MDIFYSISMINQWKSVKKWVFIILFLGVIFMLNGCIRSFGFILFGSCDISLHFCDILGFLSRYF